MTGAALGILGNQAVARYKLATGKRIQSATLIADAHHSWLDALSPAGALTGLVGVAFGYRWADPVAGFVVTAFIAHVGWGVTREEMGQRRVNAIITTPSYGRWPQDEASVMPARKGRFGTLASLGRQPSAPLQQTFVRAGQLAKAS